MKSTIFYYSIRWYLYSSNINLNLISQCILYSICLIDNVLYFTHFVFQEGDFKCDQCDKLFLLQNSLDRHRSIDHAKGDIFQCAECEHVFTQKADLIEHMQTHPLNKPFSCKQCNKDFTRKYHLDRHVAQTGCDGMPRHEFRCQVICFCIFMICHVFYLNILYMWRIRKFLIKFNRSGWQIKYQWVRSKQISEWLLNKITTAIKTN